MNEDKGTKQVKLRLYNTRILKVRVYFDLECTSYVLKDKPRKEKQKKFNSKNEKPREIREQTKEEVKKEIKQEIKEKIEKEMKVLVKGKTNNNQEMSKDQDLFKEKSEKKSNVELKWADGCLEKLLNKSENSSTKAEEGNTSKNINKQSIPKAIKLLKNSKDTSSPQLSKFELEHQELWRIAQNLISKAQKLTKSPLLSKTTVKPTANPPPAQTKVKKWGRSMAKKKKKRRGKVEDIVLTESSRSPSQTPEKPQILQIPTEPEISKILENLEVGNISKQTKSKNMKKVHFTQEQKDKEKEQKERNSINKQGRKGKNQV